MIVFSLLFGKFIGNYCFIITVTISCHRFSLRILYIIDTRGMIDLRTLFFELLKHWYTLIYIFYWGPCSLEWIGLMLSFLRSVTSEWRTKYRIIEHLIWIRLEEIISVIMKDYVIRTTKSCRITSYSLVCWRRTFLFSL